MAYQTGSVASVEILLEKLKEFAQAQNWQINKNNATQLYLSNKDGYWAFEFKNSFLFTIACTGFDGNRDAFNQPGSSVDERPDYSQIKTTTTHLENGKFVSYDFFGTSQYLHIVVQIEAQRFRHFGIGTLIKEGDYTGGQYAFGTYLSKGDENYNSGYHNFGFSSGYNNFGAVVRADGLAGETKSPWYFSPYRGWISDLNENGFGKYLITLGRAAMYDTAYTIHPEQRLVIHSQSKFGQLLIPCPHSLIAHCRDGVFRRLGILPDRYECTMNGIPPRQILTISGERWMIIPAAHFDARNIREIEKGSDNSGIQGVAYRIVE
ncbi:TPA: hypothetical protein QBZ75_000886 [Pasteurella multocida]|nr:hypothetical protein [Pasteurella multocida]